MTLNPELRDRERSSETRTLIDEVLREQRSLTAVDRFARWHEAHAPGAGRPLYQSQLPATPPGPSQQYGFEVDLDKCTGCKACVAACHSLNGLDEGETWRSVGTLVSDDWRRPFQQTITTACHHCLDPGCLTGCPVLAYEKDPGTGIVRHLDDQCIGCQYCILKCPYDVPKFSVSRGIVRKCDMCSQRLRNGEAPACAQACPNEAIRIVLVEQAKMREECQAATKVLSAEGTTHQFLPAAPDPSITLPTTRFISRTRLAPHLVPGNAGEVRLQPAHGPLIWMLILTQLGAGAFLLGPVVASTNATGAAAPQALACAGLAAALLGLAGSLLHLGKPAKAWRSFLGWRTSWLSREVLVFGAFVPLAVFTTALSASAYFASMISQVLNPAAVTLTTAAAGLGGVFCSGMVYHDTQRAFWLGLRSIGRFLATAAVLGLSTAWLCDSWWGGAHPWVPLALAMATCIKLGGELRLLRRAGCDLASEPWPQPGRFDDWSLAQSAVLMLRRAGGVTRVRFFAGWLGGCILPLASFLPGTTGGTLPAVALTLCLIGEALERYLFFRCVVPPRMPGVEASHA